jgi:hypothetical protein
MGGLGYCLCCKQDKLLTEHHDSEIKEKIMICKDCHEMIEDYQKLVEKYSNLISRDRQPTVSKISKVDTNDIASTQSEGKHPVEMEVNNQDSSPAGHTAVASRIVSTEQVEALKELIGEYKKNKAPSVDDDVLDKEIEQQRPRKHKYF